MATAGVLAEDLLAGLLSERRGLQASLTAIAEREGLVELLDSEPLIVRRAGGGISDLQRYPAVWIYCKRMKNTARAKFARFSGSVTLVAEVATAHAKAELAERLLHFYIEALTDVLERSRGDWGSGITYAGGYEVEFSGTKLFGKHYVRSARVEIEVMAHLE